jgi:hypothetical protein
MTPAAVLIAVGAECKPTWSVGFCLLASLQATFDRPTPRSIFRKKM